MHQRPEQQQRRRKRVRKANTNVLSVKLGTLTEDAVVATGGKNNERECIKKTLIVKLFFFSDAQFCDKCGAAFSHLDWQKPEEEEGEKGKEIEAPKTWACKVIFVFPLPRFVIFVLYL